MKGLGIFELLCTAVAKNLVNEIMSGTAYSRAIRAFMSTVNSIEQLITELINENLLAVRGFPSFDEYES